jgi:heme exporter protein A
VTDRLDVLYLSCTRGDRLLFSGLSTVVAPGQLLHVVGDNGSGKTTLLRTLCGLSRPAAGEILWNKTPIRWLGDEYRSHLAYLGHLDGIQGELSPPENLHASASMSGDVSNAAIDASLDRVGLGNRRSFPAKILSQGQRRRLAIARLLVEAKPLWILDEPFTGLDQRSCALMTELLSEHLHQGGLVVLSSHQNFDLPGATPNRLDLNTVRDSASKVAAA